MKTKILTAMSAVAVACMMVLMATPTAKISGANDDKINVFDEFAAEFTDREVIVFSDDKFVNEVRCALIDSTSNINSSVSKAPVKNTIALIDESWLTGANNERPSANQIKNMLDIGAVLIFVKGDSYLYEDSGIELSNRSPPPKGSVAYGIYQGSSGVTYAYGCGEGMDIKDALSRSYAWADDVIAMDLECSKEKESQGRGHAGIYWELAYNVQYSYLCSDKGHLNASTSYYKLKNWNDGYTYYGIKHSQSAVPKSGTNYRVADIYLNNTIPYWHQIKDAKPVTTSGTSTSISFSMFDPSVTATVGWSYAINDVKVINTSNDSTKKINIWHDVDENKNVGLAYTSYPGVEIRVANTVDNGSLNIMDDYGVQFGKKYDKYILGIYYGTGWCFYKYGFSIAAYISN